MRALRIVFGSALALLALFFGGCSLFFGSMMLAEPGSDTYGFWVFPAAGLAAFPFAALGAWLLLRRPRRAHEAPLSGWRFFGGVALGLIALYALADLLLVALLSDEIGVQLRIAVRGPIMLAIAGAAGWGAWKLLTPKADDEQQKGAGADAGPDP